MPVPSNIPEPTPRKYLSEKIGRPKKTYQPTRKELCGLIGTATRAARLVKNPSPATDAAIVLLEQASKLLREKKHTKCHR